MKEAAGRTSFLLTARRNVSCPVAVCICMAQSMGGERRLGRHGGGRRLAAVGQQMQHVQHMQRRGDRKDREAHRLVSSIRVLLHEYSQKQLQASGTAQVVDAAKARQQQDAAAAQVVDAAQAATMDAASRAIAVSSRCCSFDAVPSSGMLASLCPDASPPRCRCGTALWDALLR